MRRWLKVARRRRRGSAEVAITWRQHGANSSHAMEDDVAIGQVVCYDQDPAWAAFIYGVRVGAGRVATEAEAKARVEQAWEGRQRRRA